MQEFVVATALIVMSFVLVACTALQRVPYKDDEHAAYRTYIVWTPRQSVYERLCSATVR